MWSCLVLPSKISGQLCFHKGLICGRRLGSKGTLPRKYRQLKIFRWMFGWAENYIILLEKATFINNLNDKDLANSMRQLPTGFLDLSRFFRYLFAKCWWYQELKNCLKPSREASCYCWWGRQGAPVVNNTANIFPFKGRKVRLTYAV